MDRVIAQHIMHWLGNQFGQDGVEIYVNYRIEKLHLVLEQAKDMAIVSETQGAIDELRQLLKVRTHAAAVLELERNGGK